MPEQFECLRIRQVSFISADSFLDDTGKNLFPAYPHNNLIQEMLHGTG